MLHPVGQYVPMDDTEPPPLTERDLVSPKAVRITASPGGHLSVEVDVPTRDDDYRVAYYRVSLHRLVSSPMRRELPDTEPVVSGRSARNAGMPFSLASWQLIQANDLVRPGGTIRYSAPAGPTVFKVSIGATHSRRAAFVPDRAFLYRHTPDLRLVSDPAADDAGSIVFTAALASAAEEMYPAMVFPWEMPDLGPPVVAARLIRDPRTCHSTFELRLTDPLQVQRVMDPLSEVFWVVEESPDNVEVPRGSVFFEPAWRSPTPVRYVNTGVQAPFGETGDGVQHWVDLYRLGQLATQGPLVAMRTWYGIEEGYQAADDPMVAAVPDGGLYQAILRVVVPANGSVNLRFRFVTRWGKGPLSQPVQLRAEPSERQVADEIVEPYEGIPYHDASTVLVTSQGADWAGALWPSLAPAKGYRDTAARFAEAWRDLICMSPRDELGKVLREYGPGRLAVEIYRQVLPPEERNRLNWRTALFAGLQDMQLSFHPPDVMDFTGDPTYQLYLRRFTEPPLGEGGHPCSARNYLDVLKQVVMDTVVWPHAEFDYPSPDPQNPDATIRVGGMQLPFVAVVHRDNPIAGGATWRLRRSTMEGILRGVVAEWSPDVEIGVCQYPAGSKLRDLAAWSIGRMTPEENAWVAAHRLGNRDIPVGADLIGTSALGEWDDERGPEFEPNRVFGLWYMLAAVSGVGGPSSPVPPAHRVGYVPTHLLPFLQDRATRESFPDAAQVLENVRFVGSVGRLPQESVPLDLQAVLLLWKDPATNQMLVQPCNPDYMYGPVPVQDRGSVELATEHRRAEWSTANTVAMLLAAVGLGVGGWLAFKA